MHIFQQPPAEKVLDLLVQNGLSANDLAGNSFEHFFGYGDKNRTVGVVGLEMYDDIGVLRSLAVAKEMQGKGCGKSLVETVERYAQAKGLSTLFLLTDTAERFFVRLGYLKVEREAAPQVIRQTAQFMHLCSENAAVLKKEIDKGHFISIYP